MPQEELANDPVRSFKLLTCQFVNDGDGDFVSTCIEQWFITVQVYGLFLDYRRITSTKIFRKKNQFLMSAVLESF